MYVCMYVYTIAVHSDHQAAFAAFTFEVIVCIVHSVCVCVCVVCMWCVNIYTYTHTYTCMYVMNPFHIHPESCFKAVKYMHICMYVCVCVCMNTNE